MSADERLRKDTGDVLGFYRSPEGREVLRQTYAVFLRTRNIGNRKAVLPIVGTSKSYDELELNAAKSALNRWAAGQRELWRDQAKSLRILKGLEAEMMAVPETRTMLKRHAEAERKKQMGVAFTNFFYGRDAERPVTTEMQSSRSRILGLHEIFVPRMFGEERSADVLIKKLVSSDWFINFEGVAGERFMTVHIFKLEHPHWSDDALSEAIASEIFQFRQTGFAFLLGSGELQCMTSTLDLPVLPTYSAWIPAKADDLILSHQLISLAHQDIRNGDLILHHRSNPSYPERNLPRSHAHGFANGYKILRKPDQATERALSEKIAELDRSIVP